MAAVVVARWRMHGTSNGNGLKKSGSGGVGVNTIGGGLRGGSMMGGGMMMGIGQIGQTLSLLGLC